LATFINDVSENGRLGHLLVFVAVQHNL